MQKIYTDSNATRGGEVLAAVYRFLVVDRDMTLNLLTNVYGQKFLFLMFSTSSLQTITFLLIPMLKLLKTVLIPSSLI
jgi:hypothetical protein